MRCSSAGCMICAGVPLAFSLPQALRELCLAMQIEGRKAEQEAWL